MKHTASLIGAMLVAVVAHTADAQSPTPDLKRGAALYGQVCVACHAADGNSTTPANPKLAQQHPEYLIKQLQEYKSGKRANAVMVGFASALSDQDMRDIAYWLASQKAAPGAATSADKVRLGERIYRGGLMDRRIPACAGCHGPSGSGIPAEYPRLSGQHAEYTATQLKLFRSNERANSKMMHEIARYLTDVEIDALADYIAGLR
ncbi:Cytochrome c4 [Tepidimonas alkaliphilus]|uniref:Cytochrome c4 n=1 Tax=Tepidimonas alkaliphilus TaxID=2588942 RepID=A0A554W9F9_9BURK|nr:c-type cytochrome [Tepidimonas alkaliphilus]TSE20211.1 Cytochrome c4 [Tepidimonas alkaliphilus]